MSTTTTAEKFFETAARLEEGKAIHTDFSTPAEANSFRVSLYRIRTALENFSVSISIKGNTVSARKEKSSISIRITDQNGQEIQESIKLDTYEERQKRKLQEEAERRLPPSEDDIKALYEMQDAIFEVKKEETIKASKEANESDMILKHRIEKLKKLYLIGREDN